MVAEGLGATLLPDFSVIGDPLERNGVITWRPLADTPGSDAEVIMVAQRRLSGPYPRALLDLHDILLERARLYRR
jgi:DNA-binding transcriptional LysR family regulator